jgi:hypothetical protein
MKTHKNRIKGKLNQDKRGAESQESYIRPPFFFSGDIFKSNTPGD